MPEQIGRNMFRIKIPTTLEVGAVNVYFLAGGIPTLIDTGLNYPRAWETLERALRELGYRVEDIKQILLTHGHVDHIGLVEKIQRVSGAKVFLHPWEWNSVQGLQKPAPTLRVQLEKQMIRWGIPTRMRNSIHRFKQKLRTIGCLPLNQIEFVEDGYSVQAGEYNLLAIHCPGHSPGHLVWFLEEIQVLFTGDHILDRITPVPDLYLPQINGNWSGLPDYLDSLGKVARLDVKLCFSGHGDEITDLRSRVAHIYQSHKLRKERMLQLCGDGEISLYNLTLRFLADINRQPTVLNFFLGFRETLGHMTLLQREGKICEKVNGCEIFYLAENKKLQLPNSQLFSAHQMNLT